MQHFARSIAMFAAITAIMNNSQMTYQDRMNKIAEMPAYRSRGKGGRRRPRTFSGVARSRRMAVRARNKAA